MTHQQTFTKSEGVQPAVPGKLLNYSKVDLAEKLSVEVVCAVSYSAVPLADFIFLNIYNLKVSREI